MLGPFAHSGGARLPKDPPALHAPFTLSPASPIAVSPTRLFAVSPFFPFRKPKLRLTRPTPNE
jgi:hypothetical protein